MKCECGSTAVIEQGGDYVCTSCGLCVAPVFDADNGHEGRLPLHPLGTLIDDRGFQTRFKRFNGRGYRVGDGPYLRLCRSCQDLGIGGQFALQAIALYRYLRRHGGSYHEPALAPACLWHILRSRRVPITRQRLAASFHSAQLTPRTLLHALQRHDFPAVRR